MVVFVLLCALALPAQSNPGCAVTDLATEAGRVGVRDPDIWRRISELQARGSATPDEIAAIRAQISPGSGAAAPQASRAGAAQAVPWDVQISNQARGGMRALASDLPAVQAKVNEVIDQLRQHGANISQVAARNHGLALERLNRDSSLYTIRASHGYRIEFRIDPESRAVVITGLGRNAGGHAP